jgi:hypothetical protein
MEKKKNVTYTSTLPSVVMEEVAEYAAKKKISKNKVIEAAIRNFLDAEIKSELERTFKLAAEDPELVEMADWGLADYLEQLKELEK